MNPKRPRNLVAIWQQDRFASGPGAVSDVVGFSDDGGRTWSTRLMPGVSSCTGGTYLRASDPWVSIGPDGRAYLATYGVTANELREPTAMAVSTMRGARHRISKPVYVTGERDLFNDREALTAHPRDPGKAYMVWADRIPIAYSVANLAYLSKTSNGGRTWSTPQAFFAAAPFLVPMDHEILVLPDETLVNVFQLYNDSDDITPPGSEVPAQIMAMRSADDGRSWSTPVTIGAASARAPDDPEGGPSLNAPLIPSADVTRSGAIYVAWSDLRYRGGSAILVSRSDDGGQRWTDPSPIKISPRGQSFVPTLAVAGRTVGVTYYDTRRDKANDGELTSDVWFSYSRDEGKTWREIHLHGPFDHLTAPTKGANPFLADYNGLDAIRSGVFAAATAVSKPMAHAGRSDVLFARIDTRLQQRR